MFIEAVIIIILISIVLEVTGSISLNKFVKDNQEYFKELRNKWLDREEEIADYKTHMKDKAFKLFSKHFYNLWDIM